MLQKAVQIIKEKSEKIKSSAYILTIFILSNSLAFMLGFLSHSKKDTANILSVNLKEHIPKQKISFVLASRYGKKYYFLWCVPKNLKHVIYFKDEKEAKRKGYALSKICK